MNIPVSQLMQTAEAHIRAGRYLDAQNILRQILSQHPNHPPALFVLGMVLGQMGKILEALPILRHLARVDPNNFGAHNNLGIVLRLSGNVEEAITHFVRAAQLNPNDAGTQRNLGNAYHDQGQIELAMQCHRRAVELAPGDAAIHSNLLYDLIFLPDWTPRMILAEHRLWQQRHEQPLIQSWRPFTNDPSPDRRLKIGYVSADFMRHPVGRYLLPLFANHDRVKFQICCYSDVMGPDELTRQLQSHSDLWRQTSALSPEELAQQVRADGIDILVDLAQHSGSNRLLTFARKPAPVQVTWFPATTGLTAIDYRLTDPYFDPPGEDEPYTEQSIRLRSFWCFQPRHGLQIGPLPALRNGYITFGCLNNFAKINSENFQLWIKIMREVPDSRLLLKSDPGQHRDRVGELFQAEGISPQRIEFTGKLPEEAYFRLYHRIDLGLDPFPFSGHTTTFDFLWMGVPVITLRDRLCVGRAGVSVMSLLGLTNLITGTTDEYAALAVKLSSDLAALAQMRAGMRQRMLASPLMDANGYARDFEAAYRLMWREWCSNNLKAPAHPPTSAPSNS